MKLNEVISATDEWKNKLREAQSNLESAEEWEDECYKRVLLYEQECDAHPESEYLSNVLVNEVYPNYDDANKARKEAEDRLERAERVMEALKELQAALEDWEA